MMTARRRPPPRGPATGRRNGAAMSDSNDPRPARLRRQAEAILKGQKPDLESFAPEDLQDLVHELQVHQIELELQNEALRETQQALALARDEYAALYDGAPVGYFTVDEEGAIGRVNATGVDLVAAAAHALMGRPFHRLVAPSDQETFHFFLLRLLASSGPETVELDLVRADGTRFRARIEGVVSEAGREVGHRWRAAVSDVTAEYEARQALQRYADEQSALYAVAASLVTSLDPAELAGRVLEVLLRVFDMTAGWLTLAAEPSGDPLPVLASRGIQIEAGALAPYLSTCPGCTALFAGGAEGGASPAAAIRCEQEPAGALAEAGLHSLVCLPLIAREQALGILTLAWDRERSLEDRDEPLLLAVGQQVALALRNARLHQQARQVDRLEMLVGLDRALSASLDLDMVARLALEQIAATAGAEEAFLLPYAAWVHGPAGQVLTLDEGWTDVGASAAYGRWQRPLEALARARGDAPEVPRSVSRSSTPWGSDLLVVPVDVGDGPLADLVLAGADFGDDDVALAHAAAGRAGQALRNAQLYREVRDLLRRREETQALLVQNEKVAALGRLSASLSHEINNPLQSVLGCLALAQEGLDPVMDQGAVGPYLAVAMKEIERIATLVRRMREFYAPHREQPVLADVQDVLEVVVDLTRFEFTKHDVTVEWQRSSRLPALPVHADQLQQVFLNLLLNATEAMPAGGTVTLCLDRDMMPHRDGSSIPAVRIDVQDSGEGMSPEVQQQLFEPFFTTKPEGSGLGLYVCYEIVREHGGEIEIRSREGQGTTVTIWIPIIPEGA